MKKILSQFKIAALGSSIIIIGLSGCKKFISPEPVSSFSSSQVFGNVAYAQSAVTGTYNILASQNYMGLRISMTFQGDIDDFKGTGGINDNSDRDISRYNVTPVNNNLSAPYSQMYVGIERANNCIEQIPQMDLYNNGSAQAQGELRRLHGESLTLRALFYFDLVRLWGDVPEQRAPSAELPTIFLPKTNRDSIYDHILNDLKIAEDLVPWRTEVSKLGDVPDERITKGAVKALRARIALFRGGYSLRRETTTMARSADYKKYYQIAKDECADIMARRDQHTLNPSYKSVFKDYICGRNANEPNGELIFQIAEGGNGVGSADGRIGIYNGNRFAGVGGGALTALPTYFYYFDSTDLRRDVNVVAYETKTDGLTRTGHNINALSDGKFRRDWWSNPVNPTNNTLNSGINWPMIRFSDVLLMFAEADNEINQGPSADAISAVNEVSKRGHGGNQALVPTIPSDYANFFKYIVRERFLEFGFENLRKYDLIRWNLIATAITETKANLVNMAAGTAMTAPSYMAAPPSYCLSANLPKFMYYSNTATADNSDIWANSLYTPAPATTPAGTTRVSWNAYSGITTTFVNEWAASFKPNHAEILPIYINVISASKGVLTQDYGY
jgi:starch-binding outer membrane protein, SusD/RagB family